MDPALTTLKPSDPFAELRLHKAIVHVRNHAAERELISLFAPTMRVPAVRIAAENMGQFMSQRVGGKIGNQMTVRVCRSDNDGIRTGRDARQAT